MKPQDHTGSIPDKGCPKSSHDWTVRLAGPSTIDVFFCPRGRHRLDDLARHGVRVVVKDSAGVPEQGPS